MNAIIYEPFLHYVPTGNGWAKGLEDLGFEEYFEGSGVTVVEWAHLIEAQLPEELLLIQLYLESDGTRRIVAEPKGERYEELCKEIF